MFEVIMIRFPSHSCDCRGRQRPRVQVQGVARQAGAHPRGRRPVLGARGRAQRAPSSSRWRSSTRRSTSRSSTTLRSSRGTAGPRPSTGRSCWATRRPGSPSSGPTTGSTPGRSCSSGRSPSTPWTPWTRTTGKPRSSYEKVLTVKNWLDLEFEV